MLSDPISTNPNPAAPSNVVHLPRVAVNGSSATYRDEDVLFPSEAMSQTGWPSSNDMTMTISHTRNKRRRSVVRFDHAGAFPVANIAGAYSQQSMSCYLVIDRPNGVYGDLASKAVLGTLLSFIGDINATDDLVIPSGELVKILNSEI